VGGGEQGMSRAPGRCICSAAASAVNTHSWTHTHTHTHMYSGTNTHSLTQSAACGSGTPQWIRHEQRVSPPPQGDCLSGFSAVPVRGGKSQWPCVLLQSALWRTFERQTERWRKGEGEWEREDLSCCAGTCVMHQSRPRPLHGASNR